MEQFYGMLVCMVLVLTVFQTAELMRVKKVLAKYVSDEDMALL